MTTSPHYSNKPSTSLQLLPARPFCRLWHHRSLNSPSSSLILVRYCRLCPYMVRNLLNISLLLCSCLWFRITSLSPSCGVPQGSVLGPILFNMFTTPLNTPISSWSLNHHLYADDTQIFISFAPKPFSIAITQLQDTISDILSWMTANLLSLNPPKTEFMLIGLPQQISKISNPSLSLPSNHPITPTNSTRNLGFIFDSSVTFSKQIFISMQCLQLSYPRSSPHQAHSRPQNSIRYRYFSCTFSIRLLQLALPK